MVFLDVVDVKTHRSMGRNVYGLAGVLWGGVVETEKKVGLRGFERQRKAREGRQKEVLIFSH